MSSNYRRESPQVLIDFLMYHQTIRGHSPKTVSEYFLDLRMFFRFLALDRGLVDSDTPFDEIPIKDITIDVLRTVDRSDIFNFTSFLEQERVINPDSRTNCRVGLSKVSYSRKLSALRSFFDYLFVKTEQIDHNPMKTIGSPKAARREPKYLTMDEALSLLRAIDGPHKERDYCIITLFLVCGLRVSELVGLNLGSIRSDNSLKVLGKGNKERIVYLTQSCLDAINDYLAVRGEPSPKDKNALFLSQKHNRMSVDAVQAVVKKYILAAGLDPDEYSPHKLRHTAATMMLRNGVDVRTLQEVLGHENLSTTQIYTHIDNDGLRTAAAAHPLGTIKKPE
ncbi:MAG: tyrosine recombinase XerC [Clostridiales bacterium]|jgi:site-specific recombinase XerD|nr:tyrosine recombinase XerC [Clostridiales bacterium]